MQSDPDQGARLVGDRADVGVLAVAAFPQQLEGDADEVVDAVGERNPHDPAGPLEAAVVLLEVKPVELLLLSVPVSADAFEDARAVVEGVSEDADPSLQDRHEFPVEERPSRIGGRATSQRGRFGQLLHHANLLCTSGAGGRGRERKPHRADLLSRIVTRLPRSKPPV